MEPTEILTRIANGALDGHIDAAFDVLRTRQRTLRDLQASINKASLSIGDKVILEGLSPKYLNGLTGTVQAKGDHITVKLDEKLYQRRFWNQDVVRVPPSTVRVQTN